MGKQGNPAGIPTQKACKWRSQVTDLSTLSPQMIAFKGRPLEMTCVDFHRRRICPSDGREFDNHRCSDYQSLASTRALSKEADIHQDLKSAGSRVRRNATVFPVFIKDLCQRNSLIYRHLRSPKMCFHHQKLVSQYTFINFDCNTLQY